MTRWLAGLTLLFAMAGPALAHKASDGFVYLDTSTEPSQLRIDVALRDLALVVPLDANGDRQVTSDELNRARGDITRYLEQGVQLQAGSRNCRLVGQDWGLSRHSDGPYAALRYQVRCPADAAPDQLRYDLLFEVDSLHRGLIQQTDGDQEQLAVLGPDDHALSLDAAGRSWFSVFADFLQQGIWHLLLGFDHLLFLLVLILPATLARHQSTRDPKILRSRLWELAGIVSSFTVAHSLTLGMTVLGLVHPPSGPVEIIIALSIAVTAINLLFPVLGHRTWKIAFGFGLVHGFGFASVLEELTHGTSERVLALAGFNLGVEAGQLLILAVIFPLLYAISRYRLYQRAAVPAIALVVTVISLYWAAQRFVALPMMS
ncbi:HupE/UreJ family protein [Marinobacter mangrovi]|uniref:HupE/UreJ family protein n=1 Tax=Marinobacter mangrovi TaxID=2803918 RepID=UPI001931509B|nr:HupE/UreJ family protein [Marinobacter mangrovi]